LKPFGLGKVSLFKCGEKVQCMAVESASQEQTKLGIQCVGKLDDGRIVLFDKKSSLSKAIKPGDRVEGSVIISKPNYIIIMPERIVEQVHEIETPTLSRKEEIADTFKWHHSLIISIRREKEKQKSPDLDRALELISRELYGEKTHYVLELIQNAEDEDASGISFTILKDKIKVWNNGEVFTPDDVESICSVRGGKRNKIGFFGIGFKSVFNISDRPQVVSGKYNFTIEKFIYPTPCDADSPEDFDPKKGAWFILPYDQNKHKPEDLEQSMKDIDEKVLLFLSNLKEIVFINVATGNKWYLERKELEGNIISLFNSSTKTTTLWRVFNKDIKVPEQYRATDELRQKPEATRIAVAFPVPSEGEIQDVTSEPLYCYLPTKKRTDMPFLIQGDFDPTVGRENIKDNNWNKWLLLKIGDLAVESYQTLSNQGIAHELLFKYIPISEEVKDPALANVYETMRTSLKNCAIAPTEDGRWVTPANVVVDMSEGGELKNLIGNDIRKLRGEGVGYLSPAVDSRGRSILLELGAQQITLDDLIDFVQRNELLKDRAIKGPHWFLQLYAYLGQEFYENKIPSNRALYDAQLAKLKSSRMILTAKNELVAVRDPTKRDVVMFYPPKINLDEEYRAFSQGEVEFVHHYFQNDTILRRKTGDQTLELLRDKAKEFLAFLGVRRYFDDYTIINDVICKRLGHLDQQTDETIIRYTAFVRENLERYVSLARSKYQTSKTEQEILQNLGERLTVKAFYLGDTGKTDTFVNAFEAYLSESYDESSMEKLFAGVPKVVFLSDTYVKHGDVKQWRDFFEKIGVWACPRIVKVSSKEISSADPMYEWVPFQAYCRKHVLEEDWISPDLHALFVFAESLDKEAKVQRFELLWKVLNENWSKVYQKAESCLYIWTPISQPRQTKIKNTSFLNLLRKNPWVPASDGSLCEPTKLFTSTETNRMLLGNSVKFLAIEGLQSFTRALNIKETPTKQEVMNHLRQLKLQGVSYTKDTLEKFKTIYAFLMKLSEKPTESDIQELENIKNEFESEELIHIPRKDKEWWSPSKVFWKDHNPIFGKLRGYLSSFYNTGAFPIFENIGIKETADLMNCIDVLNEISQRGEITDAIKAIINSVYLECNRLLATHEYPQEIIDDMKQLTLLTKPKSGKSEFVPVLDLVLADDEQLASIFSEDLKILWLGYSYSEVSQFLKSFQIKSLSSIVQVNIKPVDVTEVPQHVVENVREWRNYLDPWVRYKRPNLYGALLEGLEKLGRIQILQAEEIHVEYKLKEGSTATKSSSNDACYDKQESKLYLCASLDPYAPKIASELCRMFDGGEALKEPLLALLSAGEDDKKRIEVFEQFGIPREGLPSLTIEKVEPKQVEELKEDASEYEVKKITPPEEQEETKHEPETTPPQEIIHLGPILIDPSDYIPFEIKELAVSTQPQNAANTKPVVRATKKTPPTSRTRTITITISPQLPEDVALELVRKFEESEKRTIDDTPRNQKNVGYDLSSTDGTSKRFIDIKSSKHDSIVLNIQRSEWRKSELEGDNYYLYIVTGLRAGGIPKLCIIQNPCNYLKPDVPSRVTVTDWNHAVRYEVSFLKSEELQEADTRA
jgi:hypothetical protein